jgi:hypothetical protein
MVVDPFTNHDLRDGDKKLAPAHSHKVIYIASASDRLSAGFTKTTQTRETKHASID